MLERPAHERFVSLSWPIVAMTVAALTFGAFAARHVEGLLVVFLGDTPALAAGWLLVWLPMVALGLWFTTRLKKDWTQAAEANYRQLVEQARDVIYRTDAQGCFAFVNPTAIRLMGYSEAELLGRRFIELIRPDAREGAERFYGRQFVRRIPTTYYEFPAIAKDGRELWFGQNVQTLIEDGRVVGFHAVARDITERKRAEEERDALARRNQSLVSALGEIVYDWRPSTDELTWEGNYTAMLGYTPQEIGTTTESWTSRIHPDDLKKTLAELEHATRERRNFDIEYRFRHRDGSYRWMHDCGVLSFTPEGQLERVVGIFVDISERKLAEEAHRASEARFRAIIDKSTVPLALNDEEHNITYLNEAFIRTFGYDRTDIPTLGEWWPLAYPDPEYRKWVTETWQTRLDKAKKEKVPFEPLEVSIRSKDGTMRTVLASAVSLIGSFDDIHLVSLYDITERKRAEQVREHLVVELEASLKRFEMYFRETPSAIAITTIKDGRFLDVNKQAEVLTGYSREELLGRTTTEMNLYVDPTERAAVVEHLREKGVLTNLERQIRTKSGEIRTAIFSLVPIEMGAEPCLLAIAHDITERKRAEQGLRERSRQQAIEAELSLQAVTVQNLPALLDTAVKLVANALEADYCEVLELLPNGGELRLYASAGWKGDCIGQARTLEAGSLAQAALQSNKPAVRSLPADTQFGGPPWLRKHGAVGGMSVSIPGKEAPWGVLGVYTAGARGFSRDDVNFVQTVASVLAATIERMETEGVLRNANQALRLLSRQLLQVQEDERRTIARDLHDEIGQSLTAIKLNVERAQRTSDPDTRRRIMQDCIQITERVLGQVRNLSLDLHPSILDDLGLAYALKWYADRLAERAGVRVEVAADPSLPRLSQEAEIACFRIAQEALTNVVRHARAGRADISLKRGAAVMELCIQDDGIGFTADTASSPASVGLASMQERAKLLGGTVRVVSVPRGGTKVIATLPLLLASPARMPAEEVPRS